jgi:uncharacterized membrane protein YphA (DoxX/SURF4 family)
VKIGVYVLGAAAIATGIVNLMWGAFDPAEEPIQAWGNNVSGHGLFADVVAIVLIVGGAAIMSRRAAALGAIVLAVCYLLFAIFCMPRLVTAPHYLGWQGAVGAAVGVGQNLIVVAAAMIVYASALSRRSPPLEKLAETARWIFGISTITFGLGHFTGLASVVRMVPKWLPLGGNLWAIVTGAAFALAGIAMLCGILDVLAAQLLGMMLLIFSVLVLAPLALSHPQSHAAWGVNVYNLAAVGAAWVLADWLAGRRALRLQRRHVPSAR